MPARRAPRAHHGRSRADRTSCRARSQRLHNILGGQQLHALVNNAGYSPKGEGGSRLGCLDSDMAVWQQTFAINFFAPVYFSRACAPLLAESGGSIVNITSIAGHRVHPFAGSAYSTSKAALTGADPRARGRPRPSRHPRQRRLPRRDQHGDPLARHRGDRRAHPAEAPGLAQRGRRRDLLSVQRGSLLHHRSGDPGERRPGRVLSGRHPPTTLGRRSRRSEPSGLTAFRRSRNIPDFPARLSNEPRLGRALGVHSLLVLHGRELHQR